MGGYEILSSTLNSFVVDNYIYSSINIYIYIYYI